MSLVATPLKMKNPTKAEIAQIGREKLLAWAATLGFDDDDVKRIMTSHSVQKFKMASYWFYVGIIREAWDYREKIKSYPEVCPICKGEVSRDLSRDGKFGVKLGWKCNEHKFHFMEARILAIRQKQNANRNCDTIERQHQEGGEEVST